MTSNGPTQAGSAQPGLEVTIVTGLSGAGRSESANVLEDLGYFVIDNLPLPLMGKVAELAGGGSERTRYAFVVDARSGDFVSALAPTLDELRHLGARTRILFLDADDDVLVRRFEATRRRHPLAEQDRVVDGIRRERELLDDVKGLADVVVDTTNLSVHDLAERLRELFAGEIDAGLQVSVVSFGFKHGVPADLDTMFDVRFLPNPHWVEELRPLNGTDPKVRRHVLAHAATQDFLSWVDEGLAMLLPAYVQEGKSYLSIGVGCTGGHHRSVVLAEELAKLLRRHGFRAAVRHRDIGRG